MIYPINHLPDVISVGVQTEQGVEVVGFDLKPWLDVFPDMKFTVWPTRPGESEAYPAKDQMMVGTVLYWHPDGYDTEIAGQGLVEIAGVCEDLRKASGFVQTSIRATSLGKTKEPGENVAPWYEAILKAAEDVSADLDEVKAEIPGILLVRIGAGNVSSHTQQEVKDAYYKGKTGKAVQAVDPMGRVYTMTGVENGVPTFTSVYAKKVPGGNRNPDALIAYTARLLSDNTFSVSSPNYSVTPSPYALKLTGAVEATYDGSSAVTVEIPKGGGVKVNILSATTLTVADAEEGTYVLLTPFATKPAVGMLCTVAYNGVEYQCPAVGLDKGQGVAIALGNNALVGQEGGNAEAPFLLLCDPDGTEGMYAMMMVTDAPSSVTVSITAEVVGEVTAAYVDSKVGEVRREIQAIPAPTPEVLTVTAEMTGTTINSVTHTYAEIVEAIRAGKVVQMIVYQTTQDATTFVAPLITWLENDVSRILVFQRLIIDDESMVVTIKYNDRAGTVTAEAEIVQPYMTRAQVVELINEMMGQ